MYDWNFFIFSTSGCVVVVKVENEHTAMYVLTNNKISIYGI